MCTLLCGPMDPVEYFQSRKLVTWDQAKFKKTGEGSIYVQVGVILSPARETAHWMQQLRKAGGLPPKKMLPSLCSNFSKGCEAVCLKTSGQLVFGTSKKARILRTLLYHNHSQVFLAYVERDLVKLQTKAAKANKILVVRFDTLSDTDPAFYRELMDKLGLCGFVDYTKNPRKYQDYLDGKLHAHHHLTFSRAENNAPQARWFVANGGTATVVVRDQAALDRYLTTGFEGFPAVDGTLSDRRWEDPKGSFVLLKALGKAKKDLSGFVVD